MTIHQNTPVLAMNRIRSFVKGSPKRSFSSCVDFFIVTTLPFVTLEELDVSNVVLVVADQTTVQQEQTCFPIIHNPL
jgi:hypothetical protein